MVAHLIIGSNVRWHRKHLGLTQGGLAAYLGVTREEISYFENGKRALPARLMEKAARLFGIDEYDLIAQDPESREIKATLAFRADQLSAADLSHIADFRKIVLNYVKMKKVMGNDAVDTGKEVD